MLEESVIESYTVSELYAIQLPWVAGTYRIRHWGIDDILERIICLDAKKKYMLSLKKPLIKQVKDMKLARIFMICLCGISYQSMTATVERYCKETIWGSSVSSKAEMIGKSKKLTGEVLGSWWKEKVLCRVKATWHFASDSLLKKQWTWAYKVYESVERYRWYTLCGNRVDEKSAYVTLLEKISKRSKYYG